MRRVTCLVFVLILGLCGTAMGATISGQAYETFAAYYTENVTFINDNTGRHLLPLTISSSKSEDGDGRMYYRIFGDVLSMEVRTDTTGKIIEMCQIIVTAPPGMELNNAVYNDFAISGYHSYALLMAMDASGDPAQRYELVPLVEQGLAQTEGSYSVQIGVYLLTCTSLSGTVTITFEHALTANDYTSNEQIDGDEPSSMTDGMTVPEDDGMTVPEDEGAGMG